MSVVVGQNVRPLNKREYILDIATEAESVDANYSLWFRRVIWSLALKLDNELYVTMHYNQVKGYTFIKFGIMHVYFGVPAFLRQQPHIRL